MIKARLEAGHEMWQPDCSVTFLINMQPPPLNEFSVGNRSRTNDAPEITVSAVAQAGDGSLIEQEPVSDASFLQGSLNSPGA